MRAGTGARSEGGDEDRVVACLIMSHGRLLQHVKARVPTDQIEGFGIVVELITAEVEDHVG